MKINLSELIADREAGTEGPWVPTEYGYEKISINGDRGIEVAACWRRADARRIARLPDLEAAYIEAVETIKAMLDAAESFQDSDGYDVCGQVRIRARKFLGDGE